MAGQQVEVFKVGSIYDIPLEQIMQDPDQPRKHFDEKSIKELSESIESKGLLQPVLVRQEKAGSNQFILVAGERRFRAVKLLGRDSIHAIITSDRAAEIALIENLQREDLNPFEEAEAYQRIMDEYGYTQQKLSKVIGKARSTIAHVLTINKIPGDLKEQCFEMGISKRTLIEVANQDSREEMAQVVDRIKNGAITSVDIRKQRKKRDPNAPLQHIVSKKIGELTKSLTRLQKKEISAEEKIQIQKEYKKLKDALEKLVMS